MFTTYEFVKNLQHESNLKSRKDVGDRRLLDDFLEETLDTYDHLETTNGQ